MNDNSGMQLAAAEEVGSLGQAKAKAKAAAEDIRGKLAAAFGGYSQYAVDDVVQAVCGHARNGLLARATKDVVVSVVLAATLQEQERWEDSPGEPTDAEWLKIHQNAATVVSECCDTRNTPRFI